MGATQLPKCKKFFTNMGLGNCQPRYRLRQRGRKVRTAQGGLPVNSRLFRETGIRESATENNYFRLRKKR